MPPAVAFCLLTHRNPSQIVRLSKRLLVGSDDVRVLIHHDASSPEPLDPDMLPVGVTLLDHPHRLSWGDGRDVLATLDLLRAARRTGASWIVLLSGQDYPLRPVAELVAQLRFGSADVRIDSVPAGENAGWSDVEATARYGYRHLRLSALPRPVAWAAKTLARLARIGVPTASETPLFCRWYVGGEAWLGVRHRPNPFAVHVGSQWFAASAVVVDALLDHARRHPDVLRVLQGGILPDEAYVQTVLASLAGERPHLPLRVGPGLHAVVHDGPRAATVTMESLPTYLESGAWFCRKVDLASDPEVLDWLDERILDPARGSGDSPHEDRLPASAA